VDKDQEVYTEEYVNRLSSRLKEMEKHVPAKKITSKSAVVKMLADEIFALRDKGYTLKQIVEVLNEEGFDITISTLTNYLRQYKKAYGKDTGRAADDKPRLMQFQKYEVDKSKATFVPKEDTIEI
jgi:transposase